MSSFGEKALDRRIKQLKRKIKKSEGKGSSLKRIENHLIKVKVDLANSFSSRIKIDSEEAADKIAFYMEGKERDWKFDNCPPEIPPEGFRKSSANSKRKVGGGRITLREKEALKRSEEEALKRSEEEALKRSEKKEVQEIQIKTGSQPLSVEDARSLLVKTQAVKLEENADVKELCALLYENPKVVNGQCACDGECVHREAPKETSRSKVQVEVQTKSMIDAENQEALKENKKKEKKQPLPEVKENSKEEGEGKENAKIEEEDSFENLIFCNDGEDCLGENLPRKGFKEKEGKGFFQKFEMSSLGKRKMEHFQKVSGFLWSLFSPEAQANEEVCAPWQYPQVSRYFFKSQGRVRKHAFCKKHAYKKDIKKCVKALESLEDGFEKLEEAREKKGTWLAELRDLQMEKTKEEWDEDLHGTDETTEASGFCIDCVEETSSNQMGGLLQFATGAGLSVFGLREARKSRRSANDLLSRQGFPAQNNFGYSLAGASLGLPFMAQGLQNLRSNRSAVGYVCNPQLYYNPYQYNPYGFYNRSYYGY